MLGYPLQLLHRKNLFTHHNNYRNMDLTLHLIAKGHPSSKIDTNMGFTSAVLEMLVNYYKGTEQVFPALPDQWRKGSLSAVGFEYGA